MPSDAPLYAGRKRGRIEHVGTGSTTIKDGIGPAYKLRRLTGLGGVAISISADGNTVEVDGSGASAAPGPVAPNTQVDGSGNLDAGHEAGDGTLFFANTIGATPPTIGAGGIALGDVTGTVLADEILLGRLSETTGRVGGISLGSREALTATGATGGAQDGWMQLDYNGTTQRIAVYPSTRDFPITGLPVAPNTQVDGSGNFDAGHEAGDGTLFLASTIGTAAPTIGAGGIGLGDITSAIPDGSLSILVGGVINISDLNQTSVGVRNTILGSGAIQSCGNDNVACGSLAGNNTTLYSQNTFLGARAGRLMTGVISDHICIGYAAGQGANLVSGGTTLMGELAGVNGDFSANNISIGTSAGREATAGFSCVNIATDAGRNSNIGSYSINVGISAGANTSTSSGNILMGRNSCNTATAVGSYNILLNPANISYTGKSFGDYNICVGYQAGLSGGDVLDHELLIGRDSQSTGRIGGISLNNREALAGTSSTDDSAQDGWLQLDYNNVTQRIPVFPAARTAPIGTSLVGAMGYFQDLSTPHAVTLTTLNVPVEITPTLVLNGVEEGSWSVATGGRLQYTGADAIKVFIVSTLSVRGASGSNQFAFFLRKNTTQIGSNSTDAPSSDYEAITITANASLVQNDYISVEVAAIQNLNDINIRSLTINIMSFA